VPYGLTCCHFKADRAPEVNRREPTAPLRLGQHLGYVPLHPNRRPGTPHTLERPPHGHVFESNRLKPCTTQYVQRLVREAARRDWKARHSPPSSRQCHDDPIGRRYASGSGTEVSPTQADDYDTNLSRHEPARNERELSPRLRRKALSGESMLGPAQTTPINGGRKDYVQVTH
jgi:hypothetical protein